MKKPSTLPLASIEGVSGHFSVGWIINMKTGKAMSFDRLIDQLESGRLILIGERHDNPEHHLIQVQILQALMDRYGLLTLAMESFQKPQQQALNRYMEGSSNEETFLKDVDWKRGWAYDYHLYRPLLLMMREKAWKILAINAPNPIVKKVARSGLGSLEPGERSQLAVDIDLDNKKHRAYLKEVFEGHTHRDLKVFEYFYEAQCVWEDTMAQNIAEYLSENGGRMVVLAGNGHIMNKYGIPERTVRRLKVGMATILLYPLSGPVTLKKDAADYVWLTGNCSQRRIAMPRKHGNN